MTDCSALDILASVFQSNGLFKKFQHHCELDIESIRKNWTAFNELCRNYLYAGRLIASSLDKNKLDFSSLVSLFKKASESKSEDFLLELFKHRKDINVMVTDWNRNTLLHEAARRGHTQVCSVLIERGLDINTSDNW